MLSERLWLRTEVAFPVLERKCLMKKLRTASEIPELDKLSWCRRIKAGETWTFTFYSLAPFVVYVHWCSGRTVSCTEPLEECRGHQLGAPSKILAYIHGYNHERRRDEFLELPQGCGHEFVKDLGDEQLRGARVKFTRGRGDRAHIAYEFLSRHEKVAPSTKLPKAETPEKHLRKLWGINESHLKLHQVNDVVSES